LFITYDQKYLNISIIMHSVLSYINVSINAKGVFCLPRFCRRDSAVRASVLQLMFNNCPSTIVGVDSEVGLELESALLVQPAVGGVEQLLQVK
jgi:hypothetical protein